MKFEAGMSFRVLTKVFLGLVVAVTAATTLCETARCENAEPIQSVTHKEAALNSKYVDAALAKVLDAWSKTQVAQNAKNATTISFVIAKDGTVSQLSIKESSGDSHQDYSAIETIISAGSFDSLPGDGPETVSIDVHMGHVAAVAHKK
jgi:outer membrane biosynthesis protein TonB